ncbi:MAG: serine/threonine protein kinase [Coriobacteriales bacterium]|nr:serine/threonine protein kinase [Coriobacteriales bacterium]
MPVNAIDIHDELLLGRYRVLEERGHGGFGTVFICWDPRLMRRVAIKSIRLDQSANQGPKKRANKGQPNPLQNADEAERRERLLHAALAETRTASMLSHPNIVQMLDFENDAEYAYIIMEYVEGTSLAHLLEADENGMLNADEAAAVVEAVCDALQFAHENGVLHLDIKPDNILIEASGRVKLADFGMAALSSATGYSGARGGTVGYMPPEQIEGGDVDVRTDIFAFACVMYEALTGVRPFNAPTIQQSLELVNAGAADPCALNDSIHEVTADALLVALDPDPDMRPSSAQGLGEELLRGLGKPKAGRRSLANFVSEIRDDSEPAQEPSQAYSQKLEPQPWSETGPLGQLSPRGILCVLRIIAGISAGCLAGFCMMCIGGAQIAAALAAGIVVGALGIAAPHLGSALALISLIAACITTLAWPLALVVTPVSILWWIFIGRYFPISSAFTLTPICIPQFATPFPALAGGLLLTPARIAVSSALGCIVCLTLCALSASPTYGVIALEQLGNVSAHEIGVATRLLVSSGSTWTSMLGFVAAGTVLSVFATNGGSVRCYIGALAALIVLLVAHVLCTLMENDGTWPILFPESLVHVIFSIILVCLMIFFIGTPRALAIERATTEYV